MTPIEFLLQILDFVSDRMHACLVGYALENLLHRRQMRDLQSLVRRRLNIRLDSGALPVSLGNWTNGAACRDKDSEVFSNPAAASRISAAARCLAYRGGPLQILQVVSELFSSRE